MAQLQESTSQKTGQDDFLKPVPSAPWNGNDDEAADCEAMARALKTYFAAGANKESIAGDDQASSFDVRTILGTAALEDCDNMTKAIARYFPDSRFNDCQVAMSSHEEKSQGVTSSLAHQDPNDVKFSSLSAGTDSLHGVNLPASTQSGHISGTYYDKDVGMQREKLADRSHSSLNMAMSMSTQASVGERSQVARELPEAPGQLAMLGSRAILEHKSPQFGAHCHPKDVREVLPQELLPVEPVSQFTAEHVACETPYLEGAVSETPCFRKEWFDAVALDSDSVFANAGGSVRSWSVASLPDQQEDVANLAVVDRMVRSATEIEDLRQLGPSLTEQYRDVISRASGELLQYSPSPWPSTGGTPAPILSSPEKQRRCQSSNSFWELQSPSPFEAQAPQSPSPFEAESPSRPRLSNSEIPEAVLENPSGEVVQAWQPISETEMRQLCDAELRKTNDELRQHIQHLKAELERRRREHGSSISGSS